MEHQGLCIIVGAGEGLGRSLAATFARNGCDIALLSRTPQGSDAALQAARAARPGAKVAFYPADATQPQTVEDACRRAMSELGPVTALIYNARSGYELKAPLSLSYAEVQETFQLEVIGALAAAKAVMPSMIERKRGSVLFSSATAAFRGSGSNSLFAIGKFGLRALAQGLAKAHAKDGVHVAHMRLDCTLDVPIVRKYLGAKVDREQLANTDDVAETYWWVHRQPKSAWSNEVELRPYTENWTY
ncbi:MAG TPA: SDR family NAD(P)-dependent oxidoreductase [Polyangiales bacterium]|nr:SDR family NAD(P)-dependent oxidoreductase [Polyangiales bacterium]